MKKQIIAVLIGSLIATAASAGPKNRAPKEEAVGVGGGAAIGAIAGGPVGLILGAAFGGWLGDRFHFERSARRAADEREAKASAHADSLQQLLAVSERAAAAHEASLYTERIAHRRDLEEALSVEVFFRTEESALLSPTEQRLTRLAALIEPMEGTIVRLEGYTDARGTEAYNEALSMARAEAVREALVRGGLSPERVVVTGVGETRSSAGEQDAEGMAVDRRVELRIVDGDEASRVAELGAD
jgi:outer membrane protein OmpA-like peptidoglycan-associated protein